MHHFNTLEWCLWAWRRYLVLSFVTKALQFQQVLVMKPAQQWYLPTQLSSTDIHSERFAQKANTWSQTQLSTISREFDGFTSFLNCWWPAPEVEVTGAARLMAKVRPSGKLPTNTLPNPPSPISCVLWNPLVASINSNIVKRWTPFGTSQFTLLNFKLLPVKRIHTNFREPIS